MTSYLARVLETLAAGEDRRALRAAAAALTERYSAGSGGGPARWRGSGIDRLAYAAVRMPATAAALGAAFAEIRRLAPDSAPASVLDLCSGPGTTLWALDEAFPAMPDSVICTDRDAGMLDFARTLWEARPADGGATPCNVQFAARDLLGTGAADADLVVLAYGLVEMPDAAAAAAHVAAVAARAVVVIVEPGTPAGFRAILAARTGLSAAGFRLWAPCPGAGACPLAADPDARWCHFRMRLERSSLHRQLKGASLAYEDEPYAYLIASGPAWPGAAPAPAPARIMSRPTQTNAGIALQLCTPDGFVTTLVPRREREAYRAARKSLWGGPWPLFEARADEA